MYSLDARKLRVARIGAWVLGLSLGLTFFVWAPGEPAQGNRNATAEERKESQSKPSESHLSPQKAPKPVLMLALKENERPVQALVFSLNGKSLFMVGRRSILLWDLGTNKVTREVMKDTEIVYDVDFSQDRKTVAFLILTPSVKRILRVLNVATGEAVGNPRIGQEVNSLDYVALSPDGTLLAANSRDTIHVWEVKSGKKLHELRGHHNSVADLVFSPDGRVLAASGDGDRTARLWDVRTGKKLHLLLHPDEVNYPHQLVFSPDGKVLATTALWGQVVYLWEVSTGKKWKELHIPVRKATRAERLQGISDSRATIWTVAFTPDGRRIAASGYIRDGRMRDPSREDDTEKFLFLWELATGGEVARWRMTSPRISFAPDGTRLATTGATLDSASVCDWRALCRGACTEAKQPSTEQLTACWSDLSSEDASRAFRAVWTLEKIPEQTVARAKQYLKEAPVADPVQLRRAIENLESARFQLREKAEKELASLGERAKPALIAALARQPGLEARRRMEKLLDDITSPLNPERLRHLRLIETLELIGDSPAGEVLQRITSGTLGESAAIEAKTALARLASKHGSTER